MRVTLMNEGLCDYRNSYLLVFYVVHLYFCYVFSPMPCMMVIGMNTQKVGYVRVEEEISDVGASENHVLPHYNQVPPPE